ncbi:MAG: hypothetical protein Q8876_07420 [Bacillota bacterium]|nr:hypothetical protein [Bacillota bacterium]
MDWKKTQYELKQELMSFGAAQYKTAINGFDKAKNDINKELKTFYSDYADENGIVNMVDVKKIKLTAKERQRFNNDVKEFISVCSGFSLLNMSLYISELKSLLNGNNITRLQALQVRIKQAITEAYNKYQNAMTDTLTRVYGNGYKDQIEAIKSSKVKDFTALPFNQSQIQDMLQKPWTNDGLNYSDRIKGYLAAAIGLLTVTQLTHAFVGKRTYSEIEKDTDENVDKGQNVRSGAFIAETEAAISIIAMKAFNKGGFEKYDYFCYPDACEDCQDLADQCQAQGGFLLSDYDEGETAPPLHPSCKCYTAPHDEDNYEQED